MSQNRFVAQVGLVLTTLAWGATFVLVKDSLEYAKPFTFIFFRFIIATIAILPFIFLNKKRNFFNRINNSEIGFGLICGLLLFIGYAFQNFGLEITIPSKSAFITSISVLIVPIILVFYKNEITTPRLWISILIV
ncbi:MAG: EamA family transporter, partial [Flavobacteriales bacterium]|nr:EamA family transporter [Flavobacteriales bacterium]